MKIHDEIVQGSDAWLQARCGILTASAMGSLVTPTGKIASNAAADRLIDDIAAQRITGLIDPPVQSKTFQRGHEDEVEARLKYAQEVAPVTEVGFITEDFGDVVIGYSPDGLVGDDGLIECKSRASGLQLKTIINLEMPGEFKAQVQTGLMVTGRKWLDFISYPSMGGGDMMILRITPDRRYQALLLDAARLAETWIGKRQAAYMDAFTSGNARFFSTERREELEIII